MYVFIQGVVLLDRNILALVVDDWVIEKVGQVDRLAFAPDVRVLLTQEPSDVREEEPSLRVVRVSVCLAELVVHPVVSRPLVNVVLEVREKI
jgi:hypothetical protein